MTNLSLWTFPTPYGAGAVVTRLKKLCAHQLIRIDDGALLTWPEGRHVPTLRPLAELPRAWKLDDAFWGLLAGMLFHRSQLPAWLPAARGVLADGLAALGIGAEPLEMVRAHVVPGTSALLLVVDHESARRIHHALDGMSFTLAESALSSGQEQRLRSTFSL